MKLGSFCGRDGSMYLEPEMGCGVIGDCGQPGPPQAGAALLASTTLSLYYVLGLVVLNNGTVLQASPNIRLETMG